MNSLLLVAGCALLASCYGQSFGTIDANHDGKLVFAEFQGLFNSFDTDSNGKVTAVEVAAATKLTVPMIQAVFNFYDVNKDGNFDAAELKTAYNGFDYDNNGEVSQAEAARHAKENAQVNVG